MPEKEKLFKEWQKFKKAESKAKKNRVEIEKELEAIYGTDFKEKSKTFKEEGIGFSINIKKNEVYKIDQSAWESIRTDIPSDLRPENITFSLDVKGYEYLKANKPEIYEKVSDCVEFKVNKPTIKIEKIK
jgi:hypothetical protein